MPGKMRLLLPVCMAVCLGWGIITTVQFKQEKDHTQSLSKQVSEYSTKLSNSYGTLSTLKNKNLLLKKENNELKSNLKSSLIKINTLNNELKDIKRSSGHIITTPPVSRGGGLSRSITMRATAYGSTGNPTKSGVMPMVGVTIAADPDRLPIGTKVRIECSDYPSINGDYIVQDTGSAIRGNKIDIYMGTDHNRMINFGVRNVVVSIME